MSDIVDLAAYRNRHAAPPGRHSAIRIGDMVARHGIPGRIESFSGTALERDIFFVRWMDGASGLASHLLMQPATAEQREQFARWESPSQEDDPDEVFLRPGP